MVSSVPSSHHNSTNRAKTESGGGQLLQELEALSQALSRVGHAYGASRKEGPPSFPSRRDTMPAGGSATNKSRGALGGLSLFPPYTSHSTSSMQHRSLDEARFSSSVLRPPLGPRDIENKVDSRARNDRHGPQLWHSQSQAPEVDDFPEWLQDDGNFSEKLGVLQPGRKSFWKWKPLRAIAHIGQQRFHVIFSLHVHSIEGLPAAMNGLRLTVHWRRKEEGVQTMPSRVSQGVAEFEETLRQRCTVYSGGKSLNNGIKYESKFFTLSVVALDVDEMEFGRHRLDLSRLLPQYLSDDEKSSSWTTNFNLTGKAKGGSLMVTFGYDLVHHDIPEVPPTAADRSESFGSSGSLRGFSSLPNSAHGTPRTRASNPLASPTRSEPGAELDDYLGMEHLCLDDDVGEIESPEEEGGHEGDKGTVGSDEKSTTPQRSGFRRLELGSSPFFEFKPALKFFPQDESATPTLIQQSPPQIRGGQSEDRDDGFEDEADFVLEENSVDLELFPRNSGQTLGKVGRFYLEESIRQGSGEALWHEEEEKVLKAVPSDELEGEKLPEEENHLEAQESFDPNDLQEDVKQFDEGDLDDEVEQVAGEFLQMFGQNGGDLNSESEPDSPRALLLKQFEREALSEGGIGLGLDMNEALKLDINELPGSDQINEDISASLALEEDFELASIMEAAESELQKATQTLRSKTRAKMLEDAETEALMQQWGLSEKAFESSPPKFAQGSYYPMRPPREMIQPPPLAPGIGSMIKMRDGGSLRSMSPIHFQSSKSNGRLVMQVSRPVVVPANMGASAVDILRHLASTGVENMALQAIAAMPLDDITGKSVEEIVGDKISEARLSNSSENMSSTRNRYPSLDASEAQRRFGSVYGQVNTNRMMGVREAQSSSTEWPAHFGLGKHNTAGAFDECVLLDELAPLAMQNIESLAIDGLKIQTDLTEDEAPSFLDAAAWGTLEDLQKREEGGIGMLHEVAGMHFLGGSPVKKRSKDSEGLLSMAISLEEWTRLDAGVFDDSESNERTLTVLAAHNANHRNLVMATDESSRGKGRHRTSEGQSKAWGVMGDTLMIAMLVQLRDPFRNYEPVGAPMMALVQAERVLVPPKPKLGKRVSTVGNSEEDDDKKQVTEQKVEEPPQFKITGVHMTGLKTGEEDKKKVWGSKKQQQSGSRWLIAQGMAKTSKHPLLKSKPAPSKGLVPSKTKVKPGDTLWSISACVHGTGERWREVAALNPHVRNPDVIFANDTLRTR